MARITTGTNGVRSTAQFEQGDPLIDEYCSPHPMWIRGERYLLGAILERAEKDLSLSANERRDAVEWIEDEEATEEEPFTLRWICDVLEIDYAMVRICFSNAIEKTNSNGYEDEYHTRKQPGYWGSKTRPGEITMASITDASSDGGGEGSAVWCN